MSAPIPLHTKVRVLVAKVDRQSWEIAPGSFAIVVEVHADEPRTYRVVLSDVAGRRHDGHLFDVSEDEIELIEIEPERAMVPPFPEPADAAHGTRALRITETHDWDGATAYENIVEIRLSETGLGTSLVWNKRTDVLVRTREIREPAESCARLFARLAALDPATFRENVGGAGDLDTVYHQELSFFDGARVHKIFYEWGRERGLGASHDCRTPAEREAFELALALFKSHASQA